MNTAVFTPAEADAVTAYVTAKLATAPPLTEQQRDRLSALLRPAATTRSARAA
jgi:hypothetical protein